MFTVLIKVTICVALCMFSLRLITRVFVAGKKREITSTIWWLCRVIPLQTLFLLNICLGAFFLADFFKPDPTVKDVTWQVTLFIGTALFVVLSIDSAVFLVPRTIHTIRKPLAREDPREVAREAIGRLRDTKHYIDGRAVLIRTDRALDREDTAKQMKKMVEVIEGWVRELERRMNEYE